MAQGQSMGQAVTLKLNKLKRNSKLKFLVDTGGQISVIPLSYYNKLSVTPKQARLKLQATNGTSISTYGERVMSISIGLRREFTWNFTIAHVETPILGADFLAHFDLSVELSSHTLPDMRTDIRQRGVLSRLSTIGLTALILSANGFEDLLKQYKSLLSPFTQYNTRNQDN